MWNFGSGKTFSEQLKMYEANSNKVFVISNVPYTRCDWFFSSEEDLLEVFTVLDDRCQKTNYNVEDYAKNRKYVKDIYMIIDEAHRYFDSRSSLLKWNNIEKMNNVLTQCRKRNIRIVAITQRLTMIDIRFRRLSDYVEEYKRGSFLGLYRVRHNVYENRWDLADIETDTTIKVSQDGNVQTLKESSKLYSEFFTPLTMVLQVFALFSPSFRKIAKEYYNTYYICALQDINSDHYTLEEFEKALFVPEYYTKNVKVYVKETPKITQKFSVLTEKYNKVWTKVENFLSPIPKKYPVSNIQKIAETPNENVLVGNNENDLRNDVRNDR